MTATEAYFVTRTLRAGELLALQPLSAPQLAAGLQVHPRIARRLAERLRDEDYLEVSDDHRRLYSPTLRLLALAGGLLDRLRLANEAVPFVDQLQAATGGAVRLAIPSYRSALCIVHAAPSRAARPEMGELVPCHCTATGKVLLAWWQAWRDSVLGERLIARTGLTELNRERLRVELDAVRERGYATERGELRDHEFAVAAPVGSSGGNVVAALGASVDEGADLGALALVVTDLAQRLARALEQAAR